MGADRQFAGPAADRTTFEDLSAMLVGDYAVNGRKSLRRAKIALMRLGDFFGGSFALDITTDRARSLRLEDPPVNGKEPRSQQRVSQGHNIRRRDAEEVTCLHDFPDGLTDFLHALETHPVRSWCQVLQKTAAPFSRALLIDFSGLDNKMADNGVDAQHDALAVPCMPKTDADVLLATQWMERMRYPDKMRPKDGTGCIAR